MFFLILPVLWSWELSSLGCAEMPDLMFSFILFSDMWKKQPFSLLEVVSSDGAPCVPPLLGVKVPPHAAFPWPRCAAEEPLWEVLESHSRGAAFGSCSLRLCVAYMQSSNRLGLDGTCHSADFIESWTSFGRIKSCSPAAIPELRLCLHGSRIRISSGRL